MDISKINKVEIRNLQRQDYDQLASSFTRVYADGSDVFWTPAQIDKLIRIFPEGQIVVVVDDKIVGCALSIIVNYDLVKGDHTYAQVTGNETFDTHTRKGNILYGIEVFIHPDYRGLRLGRRMYEYRKELCEKLNLKAIMFGGRIPNYYKYADRMRPKEYIEKVARLVKSVLGDIPVVYGGGLKEENAGMLSSIDEIDGGLIALTRFSGEIGFYPDEYLRIIDLYMNGKEGGSR